MVRYPFIPMTQTATRSTDPRLPVGLALAACALFYLEGQAFLPLLGIQNDEAIFAYAFLQPRGGYTVRFGHSHLPLMLMSYLGTLKAWIYRPIFAVFAPSVWSLREPALLFGVASVWLFFLLLRRIAGARAAVIGCGLLAVDALYLLTVSFDWGPVALQHLLLVGGMLLLVRFYQEGSAGSLAWGFFLLGLAMWDKALAVWMLSGMAVACAVVFPRQIRRVATPRRAAVAALCFALGALPLIVYNVNNRFDTFRGHHYNTGEIAEKARMLMNTANGTALFGWLADEDWQTAAPHAPANALERVSSAVSELAGQPRHNLLVYAFVLALLLAPLARGGDLRAILFVLMAMAVQWGQMAITVDAGGSVHHTILLWPLPEMAIAVSFAAASRRLGRAAIPAAAGILAVTMAAGVLQINEYYRLAWRNGGAQNWTDAIFPLSEKMKDVHATEVYSVDWGILDSLRLLNRGKLHQEAIFDAVPPPDQGAPDMTRIEAAVGEPDHVFIAHSKGLEFFEGRNGRLLQAAEAAGYRRETIAAIRDSFGRPTYEAYRFVPR
jgi:4-amino-4-deoxy-L-arabinose transferase-like glycosyltransferase